MAGGRTYRSTATRRPTVPLYNPGVKWVTLLAGLFALALAGFWLVRSLEGTHPVSRGPGQLSDPRVVCRSPGRTCTDDVTLTYGAGVRTTLDDVQGLYNETSARPKGLLAVTNVIYDTAHGEVDRLQIGAQTYQVEPTRTGFLFPGIAALVVGAILLAHAIRSFRRGPPTAGGEGPSFQTFSGRPAGVPMPPGSSAGVPMPPGRPADP
jgi:hypothetical protein